MSVLQEILVPQENVNDEFVIIAKLYVKNGSSIDKGDLLVDIETSKTVVCIEAEVSGFVKLHCSEGEEVVIGSVLISIVDNLTEVKNVLDNNTVSEVISETDVKTGFSKEALKLISDNLINKDRFVGKDLITKYDVENLLRKNNNKKFAVSDKRMDADNVIKKDDILELKPISKAKRTEIKYLSDIQSNGMNSLASVYVEVGNINGVLEKILNIFNNSLLPIIAYETSRLLMKYKIFNSYYMQGDIAFYKNINIGIAVDIDDGLKVLNLPNTDKLDLHTLENKLFSLIERYLDKKLAINDISNSTFTITDLSSFGVDFFMPLINTKQSAVLGVSKIDNKLGRFNLILNFDHRVTEGRIASEFLVELKDRVESYNLEEMSEEKEKYKRGHEPKCGVCLKTLSEDNKMDSHGLLKIINRHGQEDYICRTCLLGY